MGIHVSWQLHLSKRVKPSSNVKYCTNVIRNSLKPVFYQSSYTKLKDHRVQYTRSK